MGGRVILAALLGGLALFLWGWVAHMALPLGTMGLSNLPTGEAQVAEALRSHVTTAGVYVVPGFDPARKWDGAYQESIASQRKAGPYALMVVVPKDALSMDSSQLVNEAGTSITLALIAAFLILVAGGLSSLWARLLFCVLLACFGLLQTDVRFWNWYQFPGTFTLAQVIDKVAGGVILGLVIHLVYRRR
ncbi:MAG: hypothetical protein HZA53_05055 [Planctomycetes bacterium]|nr:hypothetical protein [Planctomycetota bacterium]